MNSLTSAKSNEKSISHRRELRPAIAFRADVHRMPSLLLFVAALCLVSTPVQAQMTSASFGYSDTWASYTPSNPLDSFPVIQAPVIQSALTLPPVGCGEAGCAETANCGCVVCPCDETCRKYAIDVSSIFIRRNRLDSQLLFFNPIAANEQIDGSQFDLGSTPGIEAGLIVYNQETRTDFEFRSTWLNEWSSGVSRNFTGGTVQIRATPPLATTGPRTAFSTYDSQFWSAEFNARYRLQSVPRATLLAGFRTMRLDDQLSASLVDPAGLVPDEVIQTSTRNRLFGFQVGADYVLRNSCNWCLRLKGRAGMYGNAGSQQSALISLAAPAVTFPASGDASDVAFHAELGAEGKLRLCDSANLLFGYRVMTLDGLAIATQQLGAINFLNQAGYEANGRVVMQAVNVGVEFVY